MGKRLYFGLFLFLFSAGSGAQTINIIPVSPVCQGNIVQLTAVTTGVYGTNSYSFQTLNFNQHYVPLVNDTAVDPDLHGGNSTDDGVAGPYPIGFQFCFLNHTYTQYWVGSNGWIGFTNPMGHIENWTTFYPFAIPNPSDTVPKNCIFGPYQDWYPHCPNSPPPYLNQNNIFRHIISNPPDSSKLVVYWNNCPMYGCYSTYGTFQIVLCQADYSVENNILHKPACNSWQGNKATQGVHNQYGTLAYVAFGRNATSWTTDSESTHYIPSGVTWHQNSLTGPVAGQGNTINVTPSVSTLYYAVLANCDSTGEVYDSILVTIYPAPVPTINGPSKACVGQDYTFQAPSGMEIYYWTVPPDGSIIAGGGSTTDSVTVHWPTLGAKTVTVNCMEAVHNCVGVNPAVQNVTVYPLPNPPTVSGPFNRCGPGIVNLLSTVPAGNVINWYDQPTGGTFLGTSASGVPFPVNLPTTGTFDFYAEASVINPPHCASPTRTVAVANAYQIPFPPSGQTIVVQCGSQSVILMATAGVHQRIDWYDAAVGGTLLGTGSSYTTPVLLAPSITQYYAQATDTTTNCISATRTDFTVTIYSFPVPAVVGPSIVCQNTTQNYSTQVSMTNYTWTVTGGTILSGAGTSVIQIHWNSAGFQTITVTYTNGNGCNPLSPTSFPVQVNAAPIPALTGPSAVCLNNTASFSTDPGMTNYIWIVIGGTITSGSGTAGIQVLWNVTGAQIITVSYTDENGCLPLNSSSKTVMVNPLPSPVISGLTQVCANQSGVVYSSPDVPNHAYQWTVTGDVSYTGNNTHSITVSWGLGPLGTIQFNEIDQSQPTNCNTLTPVYNVTINPIPTPVITGNANPCGLTNNTYTVGSAQPNHSYQWTVTGGSPPTGTNSSINITWNNSNPVTISMQESITYASGLACTNTAPWFPVVLKLIPDPAGSITGITPVCQNWTRAYSVAPIVNADSYTWWFIPVTGVTIVNNGHNASLTFSLTSSSGNLYVQGNKTGCASGAPSPAYPVTVNPVPYVNLIPCNDPITTTSSRTITLKGGSPLGGTYYIDGNIVSSGIIDPSTLSTSTHLITYAYTDHNTCVNTTSFVPLVVLPGSILTNCPASFYDPRDNSSYKTFFIGTRCWMLANLNYGTKITSASEAQTDNCIPEKYCLTSDTSCTAYGGLYQWDELMQYQIPSAGGYIQGLCPPEWHIPTIAEWQMLIDAQNNPGNGQAGGDLKDPNPFFGFHALLNGIFYLNNTWAFTSGNLTVTMFWTATTDGNYRAFTRGLNVYNTSVSLYTSLKANAFPVRCVKD